MRPELTQFRVTFRLPGNFAVAIRDCYTGVVLRRFEHSQEAGSIVKGTLMNFNGRDDSTGICTHSRILALASREEVAAMRQNWLDSRPHNAVTVNWIPGHWYRVMED